MRKERRKKKANIFYVGITAPKKFDIGIYIFLIYSSIYVVYVGVCISFLEKWLLCNTVCFFFLVVVRIVE